MAEGWQVPLQHRATLETFEQHIFPRLLPAGKASGHYCVYITACEDYSLQQHISEHEKPTNL